MVDLITYSEKYYRFHTGESTGKTLKKMQMGKRLLFSFHIGNLTGIGWR
jgi:hypothetical protein